MFVSIHDGECPSTRRQSTPCATDCPRRSLGRCGAVVMCSRSRVTSLGWTWRGRIAALGSVGPSPVLLVTRYDLSATFRRVSRSIQVSPRHFVALSDDYLPMIDRAPREDFVVRTLARRRAGEMTLMMGDLVIAGAATRETYELARVYPLHFRKTYYPGKMHGDPRVEFELQERASTLIPLPPPIGWTPNSFRSCLLPGSPLDRLSPLGMEPDESNIALAQDFSLATAAGLWRLMEEALQLIVSLQAGGLTHGDAHLHNFVVCPSPLEVLPIDFERAVLQEEVPADVWVQRCAADRHHILRMAVFIQSTLGRQHGQLADESMQRLDELVSPPDAFRRAITERTFDAKTP